ncbi:hypothetical protein [Gardnerella piotii]|uniref:hypothetical protein n=1 Tax=Gardnerella piotii TaxID=2792977 RepID=UPI0030B8050D
MIVPRFFYLSLGYRSRGLLARTSSLALKAHRAFNFEQAQRSELPFRATILKRKGRSSRA